MLAAAPPADLPTVHQAHGTAVEDASRLPIGVRHMPPGSRRSRLSWIARQLREISPDAIWVQEEPIDPFLLEMLALYRFSKRPLIATAVCENIFPRPRRLAERTARRLLWPRLDHLLTVAQTSLDGIRAAGMPVSVPASTLVAGGLEPEGKAEPMRLPFDREGSFVVGFAGRIVPQKGWRVLVEALPEDTQLVLAGDGAERAELEALAAADERVHYLGLLPKDELWGFYAALDCLAVPSLTTPRWKEQSASTLVDGLCTGVPGRRVRLGRDPRHHGPGRGARARRRRCRASSCDRAPPRRRGAPRVSRRGREGSFSQRVRDPGLRGQDRSRAESSYALASLGCMSVAEKPVAPPAVADAPRDERVTTITPPTRLPNLDVRELWRFRELAGAFVVRDLKVRYKQTLIGVAWVLIQPILATVIFTVFFGRYANLYSDGKPYQVFVFTGVIMWMTYFQPAFASASGSIAGSKGLITKVFFPRVLLPLGAVATPLVDFIVVFPVLVGMVLWLHIPITAQFVLFPLFVLLALVTAFAAGLFFAVAGVRFRDVPYAIPFVMLVLLFCSPVFWSINDPDLQDKYVWLVSLNPMTGAISGFRWAVIGSPAPPAPVIPLGIVMAVVLLVAGLAYFRRAEPGFADTI